ncbi:MAG: hypothetical protein AAGJ37_08380 [Pseudomonadota bacterium]
MAMNSVVARMKCFVWLAVCLLNLWHTSSFAQEISILPRIDYYGFKSSDKQMFASYMNAFQHNISKTKIPTTNEEVAFVLNKISEKINLEVRIYQEEEKIVIVNTSSENARVSGW